MTCRDGRWSGAFVAGDSIDSYNGAYNYSKNNALALNASKSSALYGKSSTIQAASYRRYHLIKW